MFYKKENRGKIELIQRTFIEEKKRKQERMQEPLFELFSITCGGMPHQGAMQSIPCSGREQLL